MHSPTYQGRLTLGSLGNLRFTQAYRKELCSVSLARERFREAARDGKIDADLLSRGELCLSELTGNAVRHAHDSRKNALVLTEATIRVIRRRLHLEVSVWDIDRHRLPRLPDPATAPLELFGMPEGATGGRGLLLVATLAEEVGYVRGPHGKRIWCRWAL
jgi:anti-sigma regulatory factor (Ser/Thr protein kinase)